MLNFEVFGAAWSQGAWRIIEQGLSELSSLAARNDFQLRVLAFPLLPQVVADYVDDYPQRTLRALAARDHLVMLDLLPALRRAHRQNPARELFLPDDWIHYSASGHEVIADAATTFVVSNVAQ